MKIGILGAGQLGRMLALSGYPLGLEFRLLDPATDPCSKSVAETIQGEYEDFSTLFKFTQGLTAITYEFENVPIDTARWLNERVPVYPPPSILAVAQDRILEKNFFRDLGIPTPAFAAIESKAEFDQAIATIGLPSVLKTTRFGYDGKGQAVLRTREDAELAWARLGGRPLILEGFVPFDYEVSLISVRSQSGEYRFYPLVQNTHRDGILAKSVVPATKSETDLQTLAEGYARKILDQINYVGVLAIEWFVVDGKLLANEMAPRVHNSGHWSIEGAFCSQFENHIRAVAGLPLGSTELVAPSVMWNLIGNLPDQQRLLSIAGLHVHLYGKPPRAGRKIGHLTKLNPSDEDSHKIEAIIDQY
jgi:5-(carboxyamino)imidazole ribonucleotide synthase